RPDVPDLQAAAVSGDAGTTPSVSVKGEVMPRYHNPAIRQLKDQQIKYAPVEVRLQQMEKAERLLHSLDPDRSYHYRDICEKVTDFKSEMYPDLIIDGAD